MSCPRVFLLGFEWTMSLLWHRKSIFLFYCSTPCPILLKFIPLILYLITQLSTKFNFSRLFSLVVIKNVTFVTWHTKGNFFFNCSTLSPIFLKVSPLVPRYFSLVAIVQKVFFYLTAQCFDRSFSNFHHVFFI